MAKVILIAGGGFGQIAATELLKEQGEEVIVITPEEAVERGLTITNKEELNKPFKLTNDRIQLYEPPPTRAERRKKARKKGRS